MSDTIVLTADEFQNRLIEVLYNLYEKGYERCFIRMFLSSSEAFAEVMSMDTPESLDNRQRLEIVQRRGLYLYIKSLINDWPNYNPKMSLIDFCLDIIAHINICASSC